MINSWIFDLDGTLVDSFPGIAASANHALQAVWPGRKPLDFRPFVGPPIRKIFSEALSETDPQRLDALEQVFRIHYDSSGWQNTVLYPGVAETLAELNLRGQACFVVTNKPAYATKRILEWLGLAPWLREIVSPDVRVPPYVSKTEAAKDLAHRHGLVANDTVMVGDSVDDAEVATVCKFSFVAVTYGYGKVDRRTDLVFDARIDAFSDISRLRI